MQDAIATIIGRRVVGVLGVESQGGQRLVLLFDDGSQLAMSGPRLRAAGGFESAESLLREVAIQGGHITRAFVSDGPPQGFGPMANAELRAWCFMRDALAQAA